MRTGIHSFPFRLLPFSFLAVLATLPASSEDYSAWTGHAAFRLNTGATGAALAQDVADFPLLLRLDAANFNFTQAKPDGADIRFSDPGGAPLAFEIERWDAALKKAEVWLRLPLVKAGTDTGGFRMHWGNPAAMPASDGKAVFDTAGGFRGAWHLYGGAVRDAVGASDDGDASLSAKADGLIAGARSMGGRDSGMVVADTPVLRPAAGLTFSLWVNATTWTGRNHVLARKGDTNVQYALSQEGDSLVWTLGASAGMYRVKAALPPAGTWVHLAGTYDGVTSRLYVDGREAASQAVSGALAAVAALPDPPEHLGLGCRLINKKPMENLEGRLDEVALAGRARSAEWIRLSHATQRAGAAIIGPPEPIPDPVKPCAGRFAAPRDTSVAEGDLVVLAGTADCAHSYSWSVASGPSTRLMDPDVKVLRVAAPRITRDTVVVYRFTARFGEVSRTADVRVSLREALPDPLFSFPSIAAWNGRDPLSLKPTVLNLAALKASRAPELRWAWTLAKVEADTAWQADALLLKRALASGSLEVGLCLDNGGAAYCRTLAIPITLPVSVAAPLSGSSTGIAGRQRVGRDATGRLVRVAPSLRTWR